ncbi:MBL-fold metallo-hydrolase superfamily [hydrothermal vent metagenome]|uniref:MBL-fold metallo-hydrolase superfamily n=1 Tax=hydrothermal vent metagenome TaxID=652676 RepID=A0A3B0VH12_9ZZZZ
MKLISLLGNSQMLDAGAMFGNAPKAVWSKWVDVDELNRMQIACRCLLAKDFHGKNVLFETGIGAFFEPKLKQRFGIKKANHVLLDSLEQHGLSHSDIDVVVLSHLHFDHAGGLLSAWQADKQPELLFPNAQYLVSSDHWQRATNSHPRDKASFIPQLNKLLLDSKRLHLVTGSQHELLPEVRFTYTNGHTPGMMHAIIQEDIVFCADLIPGIPWVHIPISMGYDRFPELLIDEKTAFLKEHYHNNIKLFFTHDPNVAVASIVLVNNRYSTTLEIKDFV